MNKKILAVALAMLFIATAFTACKSKLDMTEINGAEYPLATDKEGNTIINPEDNQVAVIVTDRNNEVITYENGEDQTYWLQLEGDYVSDEKLEGKSYRFAIPKGWTGNKYGRVVKNGTDDKCYIKFTDHGKLKAGETLEVYLDLVDANNEAIGEVINDPVQMAELIEKDPSYAVYKDCQYSLQKSSGVLPGNMKAQVRVHKIVDKDGKVVHYAENYFFTSDGKVYSVDYACEGGVGYDSFSFVRYLGDNFEFKAPKK